jgi:hypothetical protein
MTLDPTVNAVIIGMSGFFIGAISFVGGILDPANDDEGRPPVAPMPFRRGYVKAMRDYDSAQKAARALAPRSYNVALAAFGGLIVTVVLGIILSPVSMRWGYFIGGFFLGFLALHGMYTLALKGRVGRKTPRFLERLLASDSQDAPGH